MATYLVWSGSSTPTSPYLAAQGWDQAAQTLAPVLALATTNGDIIKIHKAHDDQQGSDVTYTLGASIAVICVDKDASDALSTGAVLGNNGATNVAITTNGAFAAYWYGVNFKNGTGTTAKDITMGAADGAAYTFDNCTFTLNNSNGTELIIGFVNAASNNACEFVNCTFSFAASGNGLILQSAARFIECALTGTAPTVLIEAANTQGRTYFEGCDLSNASNTLIPDLVGTGMSSHVFVNCKLGVSSATSIMADQAFTNRGSAECWLFNCSSGDTHYHLFHKNALGTTEVSATIYADDGAQYDGTNRCSWKITASANPTYWHPYISPWIDRYHSGTSAISLSLECLRDGNTTVYDNDEVWGEFSFQGNTGSTQADFANDRMALLGTPAAQTASTIAWTGGTTPGKFKLESGSITPAEIGHLRARVVVGEPNITVYVDPKIRIA
jgi:hypothetical protein